MTRLPYIAFSADEIAAAPPVGKLATCRSCGKRHRVEVTGNEDGSVTLHHYKCGDVDYLAGLNGKSIDGFRVGSITVRDEPPR